MKRVRTSVPSMDFDLRQLEIFCKVVELKSFSKAADTVFLAQASVSERIATLEKMVGIKLLDRLGRKVVPTKAGEFLYKRALLLLEMKRVASMEMQDFLGLKRGEVHMGGSTIPGEYILPGILGRFYKKYPSISVILAIADSKEIEERVFEGRLELGVVGFKPTHRSLISHELWKDELVLAVPAAHRWAKKNEISIEQISKEPFILREIGSGTLRILEDYLQASGSKVLDSFNISARFGTSTAVKEGIKSGVGVSILSLKALKTEIETGVIRALKINSLPMPRGFYLIYDKRRAFSPICRVMLDFLIATSNEYQ